MSFISQSFVPVNFLVCGTADITPYFLKCSKISKSFDFVVFSKESINSLTASFLKQTSNNKFYSFSKLLNLSIKISFSFGSLFSTTSLNNFSKISPTFGPGFKFNFSITSLPLIFKSLIAKGCF